MLKCPMCGEEVKSNPINKWNYADREVRRYECKNCNKKFNLYITENSQYTIPKSKI